MATINQIVTMLYGRQKQVSRRLGSSMGQMPMEVRVAVKLIDATLAVMHQTLVDAFAGTVVYSDAALQARLDAAVQGVFDAEQPESDPPPPDTPIGP